MDIQVLVLVASSAAFFMFAGAFFENQQPSYGFLSTGIGAILLLILTIVLSERYPSGAPVKNLMKGEYKVGFVYIAGDNVSVGIERNFDDGQLYMKERLYLYQFKKEAFDGEPRTDARKLEVIETGSFKKLRLK